MSRTSTRLLASAGAAGLLSLTLAAPVSAAPAPHSKPPVCKPIKGKPNYPPGCTTPVSGNGGGSGTAGNGGGTSTAGNGGGVAGLPFTGFELGATALVGAGLLGAGALTIASGRKRKTS